MQTNCKLYYKIVKTKNKTYRVVFTFDAYNRITVKNTALITGDVANFTDSAEYIQYSINNAIARAKAQLRTNVVEAY
jgi:2-phosphoglycerate kinase